MAEHMLILKLTSPDGRVKYVTGAFPCACGKTNLAMLVPTLEGWKVETIGDDIAWMKFGEDGRLYAINPRPASSAWRRARAHDQPQRHGDHPGQHDLHQLRADRRRRHLVGGHDRSRPRTPRLEGNDWTPDSEEKAAHPNARFTTPAAQGPAIAPSGRTPRACPSTPSSSAAGARPTIPLVCEAFDWEHGVFLGRDDELGDHGRRGGQGRHSCASTPSRCCRSAATTWAITSSTGWRSGAAATRQAAANLLRQLVPQGRRGQVPVAGLRREHPRAQVDLPPLAGDAARTRRRSGSCPARRRPRHGRPRRRGGGPRKRS